MGHFDGGFMREPIIFGEVLFPWKEAEQLQVRVGQKSKQHIVGFVLCLVFSVVIKVPTMSVHMGEVLDLAYSAFLYGCDAPAPP